MKPLAPVLGDADALIIVPPFWALYTPSLGPHLLQAAAAGAGLKVSVFYADLALVEDMGEAAYCTMVAALDRRDLACERFFAHAAYGLPVLGNERDQFRDGWEHGAWDFDVPKMSWAELVRHAEYAAAWSDAVAAGIAGQRYALVGCSVVTEQRSAAVALLSRVKRLNPNVVTAIGGAACHGAMAAGIASLSDMVDYVFSGEGEADFPSFLRHVVDGSPPPRRIVSGRRWEDLDSLPHVRFDDYLSQVRYFLPGVPQQHLSMPFESSRGCWWGRRHQCAFCGNDPSSVPYREKSPAVVLREIKDLAVQYPGARLHAIDSAMPHSYLRTVIPRLPEECPNLRLFYEVKANLSLEAVTALSRAGVKEIQAGVETLSTPLLKRMNKGVTAPQNIALLRYCRSAHISVWWNLLCDLPGETLEEYEELLGLLPLLRHLAPPMGVSPISIDRSSRYQRDPARHGLRDLEPKPGYRDAFPAHADLASMSYRFNAIYTSAYREHPHLRQALEDIVTGWRDAWVRGKRQPPQLRVDRITPGLFLLKDTRGLAGTPPARMIGPKQAEAVLSSGAGLDPTAAEWAVEERLAVRIDNRHVPLAVADGALLALFDATALGDLGRRAEHS
jgi:ribosomal peptide maturation radical SAM protein 1